MYKELIILGVLITVFYLLTQYENEVDLSGNENMFYMGTGLVLFTVTLVLGAVYSDHIIYYARKMPFISSIFTIQRRVMRGGGMMGGGGGDDDFLEEEFDDGEFDEYDDDISVISDNGEDY